MFIRILRIASFYIIRRFDSKTPSASKIHFPMKSKPGTEVRHFYLTSVSLTIDSWISLNNLLYKNSIIAIISFLIKSIQYFTFLTSNCDKQLQKLTDTQLRKDVFPTSVTSMK